MLKKGDIILVVSVIFVIILAFTMPKLMQGPVNNKIAVIKQEKNIIRKIDLDKVTNTERFNVPGEHHIVILVEKGRIRFEENDCHDDLCIKAGWLTDVGDSAVCLPNRVLVKIEGEKKDVDGVAY